jgi:drug/metabolite transporter (DMT)-like permease
MVSALPALALVLNAAVWGLSWWPFRQLQANGLHPLWATSLTYLFCMACVLATQPRALRAFATEPRLWLLAAASGLTNVGFNWGVTIGDVVRVVLLFYLMPAWSVMLAWLILGERPGRAALARLALALAGVAVVLKGPGTDWPVPQALPDWLGLLGGFSFALTNVMLRRLQATPAPARVMAMFGGGASLAAATAWIGGVPAVAAMPALGWAIGLGLGLAFLAGNVALQFGASRLPAHATALIMLSEVLFASISSALLGAGELTPRVLAGAALILAAAGWAAWPTRREEAPQSAA